MSSAPSRGPTQRESIHDDVELEVDVNVAAIFRHRSVAGLVNGLGTGRTRPVRIPRAPELPDTEQVLSFQQEWLWFVEL